MYIIRKINKSKAIITSVQFTANSWTNEDVLLSSFVQSGNAIKECMSFLLKAIFFFLAICSTYMLHMYENLNLLFYCFIAESSHSSV